MFQQRVQRLPSEHVPEPVNSQQPGGMSPRSANDASSRGIAGGGSWTAGALAVQNDTVPLMRTERHIPEAVVSSRISITYSRLGDRGSEARHSSTGPQGSNGFTISARPAIGGPERSRTDT